jgi:hypothetical protein
MIKNTQDLWRIISIIGALFLISYIPLATVSAASPPLAAGAANFPSLGTIWDVIEPRLVVLLILTVFDFLFGVVLAVIAREFEWGYLLHYLNTDILPILAWVSIAVITQIPAEFIPGGALPIFEYGVYATVFLSIAASLFEQFMKIGVLTGTGKTEPPA